MEESKVLVRLGHDTRRLTFYGVSQVQVSQPGSRAGAKQRHLGTQLAPGC